MTRRNINAREALKYLIIFSNLFVRTPQSEWSKLPFNGFYRTRESLWVSLTTPQFKSGSIDKSLQELQIIETFIELIDEIQSNPIDKKILNKNKKFWWINVLWVRNDLVLYNA